MTTRPVLFATLLCLAGCELASHPPGDLDVGRWDGGSFAAFQPGEPVAVEAGVQGGHHLTIAVRLPPLAPSELPGDAVEVFVGLLYPGSDEPFATSMYLRDTAGWPDDDWMILDAVRVYLPSRESVIDAEVVLDVEAATGDAAYRGTASIRGSRGESGGGAGAQ